MTVTVIVIVSVSVSVIVIVTVWKFRRSLIAHEDSVTCLKFQNDTHYFFSCSKDGMIKYWDADRFEQILFFPGHNRGSSVWALDIAPDGSFFASAGQDRSIRVWNRTEDLVFIEEEKYTT